MGRNEGRVVDSLLLGPINKYLEDPSENAAQSAFNRLIENVAKMSLEKAGRRPSSAAAWRPCSARSTTCLHRSRSSLTVRC